MSKYSELYSAISSFANEGTGRFCLRDLLAFLYQTKSNFSFKSVATAIRKMIASQCVEDLGDGNYLLCRSPKEDFEIDPSSLKSQLDTFLQKEFPFVQLCVWNVQELSRFMQHIPNVNFTVVEVEKDVVDSVADRLSEYKTKRILKNPTKQALEDGYISKDVVVVKSLVSQSPLRRSKKIYTPRLEKILVDILCDDVFYFLEGMETTHVYRNAVATYNVNEKKLLRYASRRNKQKEVESLLERCR